MKRHNFSRRAQLTLFIILALVLLLGVGITLYIQGKIRDRGLFTTMIDEVPREFQPLKDFIDSCLKMAGEDGLNKIGMHGGYIGFSPEDQRYTEKNIDVDFGGQNPTAHAAISFAPGSDWHIPYWYYLSSENGCIGNCQFATQRPPLIRKEGDGSIEEQLDRYVADRVASCVGDWKGFTVQGFRVAAKEAPKVRTIIGAEDVRFYLTYPVNAAGEAGEASFKNFGATLDVNLLEIYNLATEILNLQVQGKFLEANTMNIIAGMSGLDQDALPPVAATEFSHSPRFWAEREVQDSVEDLLAVHLQRFTVQGTRNFQPYDFPDDPIKEGLYANFILPIGEEHPTIATEFTYLPLWTSYFDAGPAIISTSGAISSTIFSWVPIKQYNTAYDISYPVVIQLSNPDALGRKGYRFAYAVEVNLRNNQALTADFVPLQKVSLEGAGGQFCNANQRNSGEITVRVKDLEGRPVPDAAIFFSAGASCLLGSTTTDADAGVWKGKFPVGIGALTVAHPEYATTTMPYATRLDHADTVEVQLAKKVEKQVFAVKKNLVKQPGGRKAPWELDFNAEPLAGNEEAIVTVTKVQKTPYDEEFVQMAEIVGQEEATLELVPGTYRVEIQLIADDVHITIPPARECKKILGGLKKKCFNIPEVKLAEGTFAPGYYRLDGWEIRSEDLVRDNRLKFTALYFDIAGVPEAQRHVQDLETMGKMQNYTDDYYTDFVPQFVR